MSAVQDRTAAFCRRFGLRVPILLAPMAGASAASLSIAVANAGGLGACGVLTMQPADIAAWASEVRAHSNGAFQLNTWVPDPPPLRDPAREAQVRAFLGQWGPAAPPGSRRRGHAGFSRAMRSDVGRGATDHFLRYGLVPAGIRLPAKGKGHRLDSATVSTVAEARAAETAGADVVIERKGEQPAAIGPASRRMPPSAGRSGCSRCCPPLSMRLRCRSSRPGKSQMGEALRLR